jgi:glycine/D-amino acid oxidase-like deaminating enzyme
MPGYDAIVVGGGMAGSALAYGLARRKLSVALIDEGDVSLRASRGNFGLVWLQSKGPNNPRYAAWARQSVDLWPEFAGELEDLTGIGVAYVKPGGVHLCFDEQSLAERKAMMEGLHASAGLPYEMLDHKALAERLPGLGGEVAGGSYCPHDGHLNPLALLHALHVGFLAEGGRYLPNRRVDAISCTRDCVSVSAGGGKIEGDRLVLAAGLGNATLAPLVGMSVPVEPVRGQILVSERIQPWLSMPTTFVRQTADGTVLFGDSHEEVGFDIRATPDVMGDIARNAVRSFPFLAGLKVVRAWAALRIWPADGYPIYHRSSEFPNVFAIGTHSAITLLAGHALRLAGYIADGELPEDLACFSTDRFDV